MNLFSHLLNSRRARGLLTLISRFTGCGEKEAKLAAMSFAYFFFLLSGYYILRPLRDEMGVRGGIDHIHWLFTGTFLLGLAGAYAYACLVSKLPRRKFLPAVYHFFTLNLVLFWLCLAAGFQPEWTARLFFMWVSVFNMFVVSVFWSFMADIFKESDAKKLFGFIAAGGTAGALTGPSVTIASLHWISPNHLPLISALLLQFAVYCIRGLDLLAPASEKSARVTRRPADLRAALSGVAAILSSGYLAAITLYIFLLTACATGLYYISLDVVSTHFEDPRQRTALFASMDLAVNIITLFLQTFVTGRLLTTKGVAAGLALLPVLLALCFAALSLWPVIPLIAGTVVLRRSLNYSITGPSREVLFTIVDENQKYKSKNFIDTVVYRGGDAFNAWAITGLRSLFGLPVQGLAAIGAAVSIAWLFSALFAGKLYRGIRRNETGTAEQEPHETA